MKEQKTTREGGFFVDICPGISFSYNEPRDTQKGNFHLARLRWISRLIVDGLRSKIAAIFLWLYPSLKSFCRYFRSSSVKCV